MKKNKMVTIYIILILLFLVGLAITTASAILMINHSQKAKSYKEIDAVVVEHSKKKNGLKSIVIEYNVDNKYYKITSKHYSKKPEKIGEKIKVKYNPKNYSEVIWIDNNHNNKYLMSGIILLSGDIFIWAIVKIMDKKNKKVALNSEKNPEIQQPETINLPENNIAAPTPMSEQGIAAMPVAPVAPVIPDSQIPTENINPIESITPIIENEQSEQNLGEAPMGFDAQVAPIAPIEPTVYEQEIEPPITEAPNVIETPVVEQVITNEEPTPIPQLDPISPAFEQPKIQNTEEPKIEQVVTDITNLENDLSTVKEEPKVENPVINNEPIIENNGPLFKEKEIPDIFKPLTEEEKNELKQKKAEKEYKEELTQEIELPEIKEEVVENEEPIQKPEQKIPEIPYDMDSPRETVVTSLFETTVALPTLQKELIEIPTLKKEEHKNIQKNNSKNLKKDALSKLLEDIENGK